MHSTVSRAFYSLRTRGLLALSTMLIGIVILAGTPSHAAVPTGIALEQTKLDLMLDQDRSDAKRYRVMRSGKRYIAFGGQQRNIETQQLTRYASIKASPHNSGVYWYGPKAKKKKRLSSKKRYKKKRYGKKKYKKKKYAKKKKSYKKKKYSKKKKYEKKKRYAKKRKGSKKKYYAKRGKKKRSYASKKKKKYNVAKVKSAQRPKVDYDTGAKKAKSKNVKVAALGPQSFGVSPSKKKSVTGGGVRWVASSGCLKASLRSKIYSVAANYGRVTVNSTCRSKARNRRVGGAKRSQHLTGNAVDFRVHGNWRAAAAYLRSHHGGYKHYGGGLFHIDNGARRRW